MNTFTNNSVYNQGVPKRLTNHYLSYHDYATMKLVLTGGFLGSGKTTAIVNAYQQLIRQNKKVAVITNDQGDQQVDSAYVKSFGFTTKEVANGCFCCRYEELNAHLLSLEKQHQPDIIFAESVGSCTDLIATIVKPLSKFKPEIETVVSVFADASFIFSLIEGRASLLDESVRYIYKKQLEESDLLIINKSDLLTPEQLTKVDAIVRSEYPDKSILHQNSLKEEDVLHWLTALDKFTEKNIRNSLSLDYEVYGEGESRLAWLDKCIVINSPLGNSSFAARHIVRSVFNHLRDSNSIIGHLKFFLETKHWSQKISFTAASTSADIKVRDEEAGRIKMLINARVQTDPASLQKLVDDVVMETQQHYSCSIVTEKQSSFKPGFPVPVHRIS